MPEKLKTDGILVQSKLPNFATALVTVEDIEKLLQLPYNNHHLPACKIAGWFSALSGRQRQYRLLHRS